MKLIKYILICVIFLTSVNIFAQYYRQLIRMPLNQENFKKFDLFIRNYAPSDSAFSLVEMIANTHYARGRNLVAQEVYSMYEPLFPKKFQELEKRINVLINYAMAQPYSNDQDVLWDKYLVDRATSDEAMVIVQKMAKNYIVNKDWDSAAYVFKKYKEKLKSKAKGFDNVIEILKAPLSNLKVTNLGRAINTRYSEWDPTPSPDGKFLYFTADPRPGGYGGEDVWASEFKNGQWNKAVNLGSGVNGNRNETIDNISADGNTVMLSGTFEGTYGNFDIYHIDRTAQGWSNLGHYPFPINTKYKDEAGNITPDGKAIIFTSDRPGGIGEFVPFGTTYHGDNQGNSDIYIVFKTDSGWSEAVNLGTTINTPYAERSAYIHPDGKTLYFSSNGHPGLGELDVFKSVRLNDTSWTEWSEPVNLGKEINTAGSDWGYKTCLNGDSAYFAAENHPLGYGQWDIFSVSLPKFAKPNTVAVIQGKITDKNGQPVGAAIKWENVKSGEVVGELNSSPATGEYFIVLPLGKKYGYFAEKAGYYPTSNFVDLSRCKKDTTVVKNIVLTEINDLMKSGAAITINNVFFDFDKFELKRESFWELNRLVDIIKENNPPSILITGHTDDVGSDEYNSQLSMNRAEAVANYLVSKGISKKIINTIGKGSSEPLVPNDSDANKAMNRRVIITFGK